MWPGASVCGLYFSHPESHYFGVGKIERDQVEDYAAAQGLDGRRRRSAGSRRSSTTIRRADRRGDAALIMTSGRMSQNNTPEGGPSGVRMLAV